MSKLNKRGFMLAEVVVVAVVIAVTLVALFTGLSRVSKAYEKRDKYYDIDAEYLCIEANKYITSSTAYGKVNSSIPWLSQYNNGGAFGFDNAAVYYYKCDSVSSLSVSKPTFIDYIDYLKNNLDCTGYNYVIISEVCRTENDCGYYTLKVEGE